MMFGMVSNSVFFVMFGITGNLWVALIARFLAELGTDGRCRESFDRRHQHTLTDAEANGPHRCLIRTWVPDRSRHRWVPLRPGHFDAPAFSGAWWVAHPYALPCLFSAFLSLIAFLISVRRLPETLPVEDRLHGSTGSPLTMAMRSRRVQPDRMAHLAGGTHGVLCSSISCTQVGFLR